MTECGVFSEPLIGNTSNMNNIETRGEVLHRGYIPKGIEMGMNTAEEESEIEQCIFICSRCSTSPYPESASPRPSKCFISSSNNIHYITFYLIFFNSIIAPHIYLHFTLITTLFSIFYEQEKIGIYSRRFSVFASVLRF